MHDFNRPPPNLLHGAPPRGPPPFVNVNGHPPPEMRMQRPPLAAPGEPPPPGFGDVPPPGEERERERVPMRHGPPPTGPLSEMSRQGPPPPHGPPPPMHMMPPPGPGGPPPPGPGPFNPMHPPPGYPPHLAPPGNNDVMISKSLFSQFILK